MLKRKLKSSSFVGGARVPRTGSAETASAAFVAAASSPRRFFAVRSAYTPSTLSNNGQLFVDLNYLAGKLDKAAEKRFGLGKSALDLEPLKPFLARRVSETLGLMPTDHATTQEPPIQIVGAQAYGCFKGSSSAPASSSASSTSGGGSTGSGASSFDLLQSALEEGWSVRNFAPDAVPLPVPSNIASTGNNAASESSSITGGGGMGPSFSSGGGHSMAKGVAMSVDIVTAGLVKGASIDTGVPIQQHAAAIAKQQQQQQQNGLVSKKPASSASLNELQQNGYVIALAGSPLLVPALARVHQLQRIPVVAATRADWAVLALSMTSQQRSTVLPLLLDDLLPSLIATKEMLAERAPPPQELSAKLGQLLTKAFATGSESLAVSAAATTADATALSTASHFPPSLFTSLFVPAADSTGVSWTNVDRLHTLPIEMQPSFREIAKGMRRRGLTWEGLAKAFPAVLQSRWSEVVVPPPGASSSSSYSASSSQVVRVLQVRPTPPSIAAALVLPSASAAAAPSSSLLSSTSLSGSAAASAAFKSAQQLWLERQQTTASHPHPHPHPHQQAGQQGQQGQQQARQQNQQQAQQQHQQKAAQKGQQQQQQQQQRKPMQQGQQLQKGQQGQQGQQQKTASTALPTISAAKPAELVSADARKKEKQQQQQLPEAVEAAKKTMVTEAEAEAEVKDPEKTAAAPAAAAEEKKEEEPAAVSEAPSPSPAAVPAKDSAASPASDDIASVLSAAAKMGLIPDAAVKKSNLVAVLSRAKVTKTGLSRLTLVQLEGIAKEHLAALQQSLTTTPADADAPAAASVGTAVQKEKEPKAKAPAKSKKTKAAAEEKKPAAVDDGNKVAEASSSAAAASAAPAASSEGQNDEKEGDGDDDDDADTNPGLFGARLQLYLLVQPSVSRALAAAASSGVIGDESLSGKNIRKMLRHVKRSPQPQAGSAQLTLADLLAKLEKAASELDESVWARK